MACHLLTVNGAVLSVWGAPTRADVDRVVQELTSAARTQGGQVVYVTRVPEKAPPPDAETRKYLDQAMPTLVAVCSTYHVVLEGSGFVAALKRGVLTSLLQPFRRSGVFFVHATSDEVLRHLTGSARESVSVLLQRAQAKGLLTCGPPTARDAAGPVP